MKLIRNDLKNRITFDEINVGDCFMGNDGDIYMKIIVDDDGGIYTLNLQTGIAVCIPSYEEVFPRECVVQVNFD